MMKVLLFFTIYSIPFESIPPSSLLGSKGPVQPSPPPAYDSAADRSLQPSSWSLHQSHTRASTSAFFWPGHRTESLWSFLTPLLSMHQNIPDWVNYIDYWYCFHPYTCQNGLLIVTVIKKIKYQTSWTIELLLMLHYQIKVPKLTNTSINFMLSFFVIQSILNLT